MRHQELVRIDDKTEVLVQTAQLDAMSRDDFVELYLAHQPHEDDDYDHSQQVKDAEKWADEQHTVRKRRKK